MRKRTVRRYSLYAVMGILLILVLILMIGAVDAATRGGGFLFISSYTPSPTMTATATNTPTNTQTATPTDTPAPVSPTPTDTLIPTDTPIPTATFTPLPTFDETAFVETFYMQVTETADAYALLQTPSATPEIPDRELRTGLEMVNPDDGAALLSIKTDSRPGQLGFWIRWNEVTNAEYRRCVEEGACKPPEASGCAGISGYYDAEEFRAFPVVNVTQRQAAVYCIWAGMELMTLQDWEAAAEAMASGDVNMDMAVKMPLDNGASNIIGNVWEWTRDYTDDGRCIIAGGSWKTSASDIRMGRNAGLLPVDHAEDLGFRCVRYVK